MLHSFLRTGVAVLAAATGLASHAPEPSRSAAAPMQLLLLEEFHAVGAEPIFLTHQVKSDFQRIEREGRVDFEFELTQFNAIIGQEEELQYVVERGVDGLTLGQDPATQAVSAPGEATVVDFVNEVVGGLDGKARTGTWTDSLRLADGDVIPGISSVDVDVEFTSEPLAIEETVYTLLQFRTGVVQYEASGSDVEVSYRGLGIIDVDKRLVYHAVFQQSGSISTDGARSQLSHVKMISLLNAGDEPLVELDGEVLALIDRYVFRPRPSGDVNPEVRETSINPAWATGVWLTGNIGETVLGLVAEQSTNPLPLTSLGSLVLADQVIGYAGNLYVDYLDVEAGRKTEEQVNLHDREFLSPIESAYAADDEATRLSERLSLVGPDTTGALTIGGELFAVGVTAAVAAALLETASATSLGFASAGSATAAGSAAAAASAAPAAGGLSLTTIGLGAVGVGGVAAAVASGGSDDPTFQVDQVPEIPAPFEDVVITATFDPPPDPPIEVRLQIFGTDDFERDETQLTNSEGVATFEVIPGAEAGVTDNYTISAPGFATFQDSFTY